MRELGKESKECGSVRAGERIQKCGSVKARERTRECVWWNDKIKATVNRKVTDWKEVP